MNKIRLIKSSQRKSALLKRRAPQFCGWKERIDNLMSVYRRNFCNGSQDQVDHALTRDIKTGLLKNDLIFLSSESFADFVDNISRSAKPIAEIAEFTQRLAPWERASGAKR